MLSVRGYETIWRRASAFAGSTITANYAAVNSERSRRGVVVAPVPSATLIPALLSGPVATNRPWPPGTPTQTTIASVAITVGASGQTPPWRAFLPCSTGRLVMTPTSTMSMIPGERARLGWFGVSFTLTTLNNQLSAIRTDGHNGVYPHRRVEPNDTSPGVRPTSAVPPAVFGGPNNTAMLCQAAPPRRFTNGLQRSSTSSCRPEPICSA